MTLADIRSVLKSITEQYERDIERAIQQQNLTYATLALGGKFACERIEHALEYEEDRLCRLQQESSQNNSCSRKRSAQLSSS